MKKISLVHVKENRKVKIVEVVGAKQLQARLMSMGLFPGREVIKLSQFMLKGPLAVKVGRAVLALGYATANKIIVETE